MNLQHRILITTGIFTIFMACCWAVIFAASLLQVHPWAIVALLAGVVIILGKFGGDER